MLRRLFAVLAGLLVPLCALPSAAALPILVVYPFAVNGSAPQDLGAGLSERIAAEIVALGGVDVVRGRASTKPADYSRAARAAGADLYFSGAIVPVFNNYSAIENLVSTRSGTVVWSGTIQFRTLDDVIGQGARIRTELVRGAAAPPPGSAAAGTPLITSPPFSGYALLPIAGSALNGDRAYALRALLETLQARGYRAVTVTSAQPIDPATDGLSVCIKTNAQTLIAGALDTTRVATASTSPQTTAHIALRTYDCGTHTFDQQATVVNHIAPIANDAIRGAIEDAVSAFPSPS